MSRQAAESARAARHEVAHRVSRRAATLDVEHLDAILAKAADKARQGAHDRAYELFQAALGIQRGVRKPADEVVGTLCHMAVIKVACGEHDAADLLYGSALELLPLDPRALGGACRAAMVRGDRVAASALAEAAAAASDDPAATLVAAANHLIGEHADPLTGIVLLAAALARAPRDPGLLQRVVDLARSAGRPREAADACLALAELAPDGERRGKLYHRAGKLVCEHDAALAVRCFERAIAAYFAPGSLIERDRARAFQPFAELEKLLRRQHDFAELDRALRGMIKRLGSDAPELGALWQRLGEVHREKLGQRDAALSAFEVAAAIDQDRLTNHRVLVELYAERGDDELDKRHAALRRLVAAEPFNPTHHHGLRDVHQRRGEHDRAYLAARVAGFLGAARSEDEALLRRFRPGRVVWPRGPLGDEIWALLRHPGEDPHVSLILGAVAQSIALGRALPPRKLGLRDLGALEHDPIRHVFRSVAGALGLAAPALAIDPRLDADVVLANARERGQLTPTFVVGRHLFQRQSGVEMTFALARALTYARPAYYLRLLLADDRAVAAAWSAALAIAGAEAPRPPGDPMADALARHLDPAWRAQLVGLVKAYLDRGVVADPAQWCRAIDSLSRRVGLLVCGDLGAAAGGMHREPLFAARVPYDERLGELIVHSVSDEHARARRELGLAIDG